MKNLEITCTIDHKMTLKYTKGKYYLPFIIWLSWTYENLFMTHNLRNLYLKQHFFLTEMLPIKNASTSQVGVQKLFF